MLVITCSDQQVFTGGAYAITLRFSKGCSISAYHYNIVGNMLLITCATHLMAVTIGKHYWEHPFLASLRVVITTAVFVATGVFLSNQGMAAGSQLGFPTEVDYTPPGATVYFDRSDVKRALHAPANITWSECSNESVFVGVGGPEGEGDLSANPIEHVLPQVIEGTNRVLIANGDFDMVILTQGTLLSIQNMTWNGKLGFETEPATPINIELPDLQWDPILGGATGGQGDMGIQHYERGLMWAETYQSGHMQPQYQPRVSYRHLQWLLGRIDKL